jgi:hypothetical protein
MNSPVISVMNSPIISVMNSQILKDRRLRFARPTHPTLPSWYLDAICKTHDRLGFFSGLSTAISGLAIVSVAPVSMVKRHGFPSIQPSAIRLSFFPGPVY